MAGAASAIDRSEEHAWLARGHAPFAGKYTVERILGQGGMGVVFEARHIRLGQRVAIKVLGSALREYPELVERFEREARAAGSLTSAHAVRVFDIDFTEDGTPFIVMELLAGRDLSTIVERDGPQPVARSVRWVIEACDAIAEAHRLGIIHRDLKPSNLFLTDVEGRQLVKVLDFGIAKRVSTQEAQITQAVAPLGTPQYMSPEQVRCAKDVDARTDVWSLGVTLYEMICGQTPFAHESASACIASIAADPVPDPRTFRPDLSESFCAVLMKALAKNARDRYQSVAELVKALAPFSLEDDEGDDELVSAVRRAYVLVEDAASSSRDRPTLDAVDAAAELLALPSPAAVAVGVRSRLESGSDRTVPPAISLASMAPRRSKLRGAMAMASAAALGLAALVLTPRCVTTSEEPAHAVHATQAVATTVAAAPPVATTTAAVEQPVAAPVAEPAAAPVAPAAPVVVAPSAPAAAPAPAAPLAAPLARVAVAVGSSALDAKHVAAMRKPERTVVASAPSHGGVHGGLSNPGF